MDQHRLRDRARRGHAAHRVPRAALRPEARLRGFARAVPGRLGALRSRGLARLARDLPRAPGPRRGRAPAHGAGDPAADLPATGAGHGDGGLRDGRHARPRGGADARRLHRRPLALVLDLLHQPSGRRARPLHGDELRARGRGHPRQEPEARRGAAQERRLARASGSSRSGSSRSSTSSRRGSATTGSRRRTIVRVLHRGLGRARGVRDPRAHDAVARGEPPALQGSGVHVGDGHRRADVRDADGEHVPLAALHAGAARLHRDAVRPRAHAARPRDDGGDADRRAHLQPNVASRDHRARSRPRLARVVSALRAHARLEPSRRRHGDPRAGRGVLVPVRAAHDARVVDGSRATSFRTRRGSTRSSVRSAAPSGSPSSPPCSRATRPWR